MEDLNHENKIWVIRQLVKNGFGLPEAIQTYKTLSADGFYELEKKEVRKWIKENGY